MLFLSCAANAQETASPPEAVDDRTLDIHALIQQVAEDVDKEIIVDPRLRSSVGAGYTTKEDADYESLLAILRINSFAIIETADQLLIVPEQITRSSPSRILQDDDSRVSDHEIVTRLIKVPRFMEVIGENDDGEPVERSSSLAPMLVPVLRPMLPQTAQLGAIPGANTLVIVDRYDNVRRITAIVEQIVEHLDD